MYTVMMTRCRRHLWSLITFSAALLVSLGLTDCYGESPKHPSTPLKNLNLGERIYREGTLPSGEPLRASVKGGNSVPGITFACISCHLRSGVGAFDEGVYTPPINGTKLFRPLPSFYKGIEQDPAYSPPLRPAYSEESLIQALRSGSDPNGRVLNDVMPRYLLGDNDAQLLVAYLKSLSSQFSPGISDTTIRFATVISEDIRPETSEAMFAAFKKYFDTKNFQAMAVASPGSSGVKTRRMAESMIGAGDLVSKSITLAQWTLKGPPETWRSQLEEYDRKEPVFALLGGIVSGAWKPVHQFCEEKGIPCLFPNTEFPVVSDSEWYTLYLSKGYYQEGESAARYLNSRTDLPKGRPVVQIVRASLEAEALSAGFTQTWQNLGQKSPVKVLLPRGEVLDSDFLQRVITREKPAGLAIWDNATALQALEQLSLSKKMPVMFFLSARYLGESVWSLKESIRGATYLTYPFSFSPYLPKTTMGKQRVQDDPQKTLKKKDIPLKDEVRRISSLTDSLTQMLTFMLMDLKGNYYRDTLLDVAGMMTDQRYPLYGRISFGTGQRYASRGCTIVQLSKGDDPELVKKSDWEIP